VDGITLNGKPASSALAWDALGDDNMIEVRLGKLLPGQQAKRSVTAKPLVQDAAVYAPAEPRIAKLERGAYGYPTLQIEGSGKGIVYNIYRNGQLVGPRISAVKWADRRAGAEANLCYAVEAVYAKSGNRSHHSMPVCLNTGEEIQAAASTSAPHHSTRSRSRSRSNAPAATPCKSNTATPRTRSTSASAAA
jgi:hypothetical protein